MPQITPQSGVIYFQEKANWCWAAAASHVSDCLSVRKPQCSVVGQSLPGYAVSCSTDACDVPFYLHLALGIVNHYGAWYGSQLTRSQIMGELLNGHPVGIRIQWENDTDGHFIVIVGFTRPDPNTLLYKIYDPSDKVGLHVLSDATLRRRYRATGRWTETITTC